MNGNGFGNQSGRGGNGGAKSAGNGRGSGMCRRAPGTQEYASGFGKGRMPAAVEASGQSPGEDRDPALGDVSVQTGEAVQPGTGRGISGCLRRRDGSCGRQP